jgi:ribosomal subunit interface protein
MEIKVTGRKINVGEALTTHIEDRLNLIAEKYFNRSIDAAVIMSKESHLYHADCTFHVNQGVTMQGHGEADDPYGAFEDAAEKVEKQLRRYKRRIKNHHNSVSRDAVIELFKHTTLAPHDEEVNEEAMSHDDHQPLIIAETHKEIPTLSVGDATMFMDLANESVFMFRNAKSNSLEVVYKRSDGNFGWISPE